MKRVQYYVEVFNSYFQTGWFTLEHHKMCCNICLSLLWTKTCWCVWATLAENETKNNWKVSKLLSFWKFGWLKVLCSQSRGVEYDAELCCSTWRILYSMVTDKIYKIGIQFSTFRYERHIIQFMILVHKFNVLFTNFGTLHLFIGYWEVISNAQLQNSPKTSGDSLNGSLIMNFPSLEWLNISSKWRLQDSSFDSTGVLRYLFYFPEFM